MFGAFLLWLLIGILVVVVGSVCVFTFLAYAVKSVCALCGLFDDDTLRKGGK